MKRSVPLARFHDLRRGHGARPDFGPSIRARNREGGRLCVEMLLPAQRQTRAAAESQV